MSLKAKLFPLALLFLSTSVAGCRCNCEPTVTLMANDFKTLRTEDYEAGHVSYEGDKELSDKLVKARIELIKAAENNAAALLNKPKPHVLEGEKEEESK